MPGGGDVAAAALSGYIVLTAAKRGVPKAVIVRMLLNVLVDTAVGTVPVLGDLFDVAFKSNVRNVELLERHTAQPAVVEQKSRLVIVGVVAVLLLIAVAVGTLGFLVARALWRLLTA